MLINVSLLNVQSQTAEGAFKERDEVLRKCISKEPGRGVQEGLSKILSEQELKSKFIFTGNKVKCFGVGDAGEFMAEKSAKNF